MGGCRDKRFADMLYAYELGMLGEEERRELELHLLDCEQCFEDVREFRAAAGLLKHDAEVRESVRKFVEQQPASATPARGDETAGAPHRRFWPRFVPAALLAAAALIILIFKPWEIEIHPTHEAVAVSPRLAIMYFDNVADQEDVQRLGEIATNLLITDLSESGYLQVISRQRLYDILKLLGKEGQKRIDRDIARQVADTAGADVMLLGNILQTEPHFVLTARLIEVFTGNVIASQRVAGEPGEDIFSMVDKLTTQIKGDLTLPAAAGTEPDRRVAEVTTHSPEAYRYYLRGIDLLNKYYQSEAAENFTLAIELDSTFAMAHYYLSELVDTDLIEKAMRYLDRASQKEQYLIRSRHAVYTGNLDEAIAELDQLIASYPDEKTAYYLLGRFADSRRDYDQSIAYLNQAMQIDPLYRQAINYVAYVYNRNSEYELAIGAINRYIALAPDEPNPYDTRGDIYAKNGKVDLAIASFRKALAIKPDFRASLYNLGHMYVLKHEYAAADSAYRKLAADEDINTRSMGRIYLPYPAICRGKFAEAIRVLDEALAADSADGLDNIRPVNVGCKHFVKARVCLEQKEYARAIEKFEEYMAAVLRANPEAVIYERNYYAQLLTETGELARAEAVAESLKTALEAGDYSLDAYWHVVGCLELAGGNAEAAIAAFKNISAATMDYPKRFLLARAYFEAGQLAEAAAGFEALLIDYSSMRAFWCIWDTKVRYYLGRVYEESRWFNKAVTQYEAFLDIWNDADPGIPEIDDARERLARLKLGS